MVLQNSHGGFTEMTDDFFSRFKPDALDSARGQILDHAVGIFGDKKTKIVDAKLLTESWMLGLFTLYFKEISFLNIE